MSFNISELSGRKGLDRNLFEAIGEAAKTEGTVPSSETEKLADEFLLGKANVLGSVSFYDFTREENRGKKVYVCNGSACLCAGTQAEVKLKLEAHFSEDEIGEMCCLGRCHENNAFHYGGFNYSGDDIDTIQDIKSNLQEKMDQYHVGVSGQDILTKSIEHRESFYQLWKEVLDKASELPLEALKASGLRGRGGAGFPTSFKLETCRNTQNKIKFIVCNADEGDPGAYSDRYLLEHQAPKVLLGMMIAGFVAGASHGVLYIRGEYPESISRVQSEIQNLLQEGLLGENILGSVFSFSFKVIRAQGAYICGEETALLSSIEGQRPEVRVRPPFPAQSGLFNKPTLVCNVETFACIPFIVKEGGETFAAIGRGKSTGTKLISLDSAFNRPGIYEVDMGTPLKLVIDQLGQGFKKEIKAMHIGGPLGGLVPLSKVNDLTIDFESFQNQGFLLGHASVVCIPNDFPLIKYIQHLFEFTAHESCGKCFPCRLGSTRGAELIQKATNSDYKIDKILLNDLLETLEIGSLCALGGGLPLPIKNAMNYFEDELKEWIKE